MDQLQLLQPFLGLVLATFLRGEPIGWDLVALLAAIVGCVAGVKRFAR